MHFLASDNTDVIPTVEVYSKVRKKTLVITVDIQLTMYRYLRGWGL